MDAASALADLTEISSQVEAAVVLDDAGAVVASTLDDAERSARLARAALDLLGAADKRFESGGRALTQLEAALREGSVFVAREEGRSIVATTSPEPTSGLVFYDLKTCLRSLAESSRSRSRSRRGRSAARRRESSPTRKPMRRLLVLLLFVGGPVLYLSRRRDERRERVHLYYDDGSMVTLERGAPEAEQLLAVARGAL